MRRRTQSLVIRYVNGSITTGVVLCTQNWKLLLPTNEKYIKACQSLESIGNLMDTFLGLLKKIADEGLGKT